MSTTNRLNDTRNPSTTRLSEKFDALKDRGVKDVKFWYVGGSTEQASVDDLSAEVLTIFEAYESKQPVDIKDKLK